jgi:hypothetical protein
MSHDSSKQALLLVYNADSGIFNALADSAHKLFSPATYDCKLCALTYGAVAMREEWATFLSDLKIPLRFLHRDEFHKEYPGLEFGLPAILSSDSGTIRILLSAESIKQCSTFKDLKDALQSATTKTAG